MSETLSHSSPRLRQAISTHSRLSRATSSVIPSVSPGSRKCSRARATRASDPVTQTGSSPEAAASKARARGSTVAGTPAGRCRSRSSGAGPWGGRRRWRSPVPPAAPGSRGWRRRRARSRPRPRSSTSDAGPEGPRRGRRRLPRCERRRAGPAASRRARLPRSVPATGARRSQLPPRRYQAVPQQEGGRSKGKTCIGRVRPWPEAPPLRAGRVRNPGAAARRPGAEHASRGGYVERHTRGLAVAADSAGDPGLVRIGGEKGASGAGDAELVRGDLQDVLPQDVCVVDGYAGQHRELVVPGVGGVPAPAEADLEKRVFHPGGREQVGGEPGPGPRISRSRRTPRRRSRGSRRTGRSPRRPTRRRRAASRRPGCVPAGCAGWGEV